MIIIQSIDVSKPFKYLWLKHVTGVDLSQHCAKCLVGSYSKAVSSRTRSERNIQLSDGIYYLCGVSMPYVWQNNFHLAFEYAEGESFTYNSNGIDIVVQNATMLPISDFFIDNSDEHADVKAFRTCRNWQFAHYLKRVL